MLKILIRTSGLAAMIALLQACSWFRDKPPEYVESADGVEIVVPEDLDMPQYQNPISILHPDMRMPAGDELNPGPPRVVSTAGRGDANAYMAWSARGVYLLVRDTPDSVSRRLGFTIDRAGMKTLESQTDGEHRFEYYHIRHDERSWWRKMAFWNDGKGPNYSGVYRTHVEADGEDSRVYLLFDNGDSATTNAAEHVLGIFMERLG
jgi:uncharacterized lipoprotein